MRSGVVLTDDAEDRGWLRDSEEREKRELGGSRRSSRESFCLPFASPRHLHLRFRTYVNVTLFPSIHPRAKRGKRGVTATGGEGKGRGVVARATLYSSSPLLLSFSLSLARIYSVFIPARTTENVHTRSCPVAVCDFCCKELESLQREREIEKKGRREGVG